MLAYARTSCAFVATAARAANANGHLLILESHFMDADGRGYSYARTLPVPQLYRTCPRAQADALLREQTRRRLETGYYNALIVTTQVRAETARWTK